MPAIAALTANDGQATPVAHTFSPVGISTDGVAEWVDRSGGIAVGFPTVTVSMRKPTKGSRVYKVTRKIVVPVLETISNSTVTGILPAPTKAYDMINISEWVLPERSTLQDRKNLVAFVKNIDALATIVAVPQDYDNFY